MMMNNNDNNNIDKTTINFEGNLHYSMNLVCNRCCRPSHIISLYRIDHDDDIIQQ